MAEGKCSSNDRPNLSASGAGRLGHMYLVVIDVHSKWMDVHIMRSTTSAAAILKIRQIFATHGLPETIVSDNGPNFHKCRICEVPCRKNGIKHTSGTSHQNFQGRCREDRNG